MKEKEKETEKMRKEGMKGEKETGKTYCGT